MPFLPFSSLPDAFHLITITSFFTSFYYAQFHLLPFILLFLLPYKQALEDWHLKINSEGNSNTNGVL